MSFITLPKIRLAALGAALLLGVPAVAGAYNYAPSDAPRHKSGGTYYYSDQSRYSSRSYSRSCCRSETYGERREYLSSCGCYSTYYTGRRHTTYSPDLYDYAAQVYDDRAHYDRRTPYEYRWPRNNY